MPPSAATAPAPEATTSPLLSASTSAGTSLSRNLPCFSLSTIPSSIDEICPSTIVYACERYLRNYPSAEPQACHALLGAEKNSNGLPRQRTHAPARQEAESLPYQLGRGTPLWGPPDRWFRRRRHRPRPCPLFAASRGSTSDPAKNPRR